MVQSSPQQRAAHPEPAAAAGLTSWIPLLLPLLLIHPTTLVAEPTQLISAPHPEPLGLTLEPLQQLGQISTLKLQQVDASTVLDAGLEHRSVSDGANIGAMAQ